MLKLIFLDINPFLLVESKIIEKVWNNVLSWDQLEKMYRTKPELKEFLSTKPDPYTNMEQYLIQFTNDEYTSFLKFFNKCYFSVLENCGDECFNMNVIELINDAILGGINVVLLTQNNCLLKVVEVLNLPKQVSVISSGFSLDKEYNFLTQYCTESNIMCDEYITITTNEKTLIDMQRNEIFCVTLNSDKNFKNSKNLYVVESIDDLNFGEISYTFYSRDSTEDI